MGKPDRPPAPARRSRRGPPRIEEARPLPWRAPPGAPEQRRSLGDSLPEWRPQTGGSPNRGVSSTGESPRRSRRRERSSWQHARIHGRVVSPIIPPRGGGRVGLEKAPRKAWDASLGDNMTGLQDSGTEGRIEARAEPASKALGQLPPGCDETSLLRAEGG